MVQQHRTVEEFMRLVQIDSPTFEERELADYLKAKFTALGVQIFEDEAGEKIGLRKTKTGNLIGKLSGSVKSAPVILLCAHMDTVEPGRGVKPFIRDGSIFSDGTTILGADDKAGIAAIIEAVQVLREYNIPHGDLEFLFTVAEEGGLRGAKSFEPGQLQAEIGYVLDCDGPAGTIITRAPAQYRIAASVIGRAAHAGISPEDGINAIAVASAGISKMKLGRIDEETTANIGVISGGKATNIIPDLVNIEGEARSFDLEKLEKQADSMIEALDQAAREMGADVKVTKELLYPRVSLHETDKAVRIAVTAAHKINCKPVLSGTGGGSDANILNGMGLQIVNLGVGMTKVHSTEEFITIENLLQNARYLLEVIKTAALEKRS